MTLHSLARGDMSAGELCTKSYTDQDGFLAMVLCNDIHRMMNQHESKRTFKWRTRARAIIRQSRRTIASVNARSVDSSAVDKLTCEHIDQLRSMLTPLEQACRLHSGCIEAFLLH